MCVFKSMELDFLKKSVLKSVKVLYERGLTSSLSGNISVRTSKGFIITPSSVPRWAMTVDDLVYLSFKGEVLEGSRRPSSEWRMHLKIYLADTDVNAIVHAHPKHTLALSLVDRLDLLEEELVVVPYEKPGSEELASKVAEAVKRKRSKAFILEKHGAVVVDRSLESATALMEALEEVAEIAYLYLLASKPRQ